MGYPIAVNVAKRADDGDDDGQFSFNRERNVLNFFLLLSLSVTPQQLLTDGVQCCENMLSCGILYLVGRRKNTSFQKGAQPSQ